jgi:hypothetical protein
MINNSKFKLNDLVFCTRWGDGKVSAVDNTKINPIEVTFDSGYVVIFNEEGSLGVDLSGNLTATVLSKKEPGILSKDFRTAILEYQKGDIVEAFGVRGKVTNIIQTTVIVDFFLEDKRIVTMNFYSNGTLYYWHKEPTLKFISRPKKKVKKTFYTIVGRAEYDGEPVGKYSAGYLFETKEECLEYSKNISGLDFPIVPIELEVGE